MEMKALGAGLALFLLMGARMAAQEHPIYGSVSIVAASASERGLSTANQMARSIADVLTKENKVAVAGVESPAAGSLSDEMLLKRAGDQTHWVAVVNFDPKDSDGVCDVEVAHITTARVVSRVSAWFGVIPTGGLNAAAAITRAAKIAADEIVTLVSLHREVRVILYLLTHPGNADYTLGTSDLNQTDGEGIGKWEGTQPVGRTVLRVMKPGYAEASLSIDIAVPGEGQPFIPLSESVELHSNQANHP
jgi:hypothetical protein